MHTSIPIYVASAEEEAAFARAVLIYVGIVVCVLVSGSFCAWLAHVKGRPVGAWFLLGLVFGPFALLAIVGAPTVMSREARWSAVTRGRKRRPRSSQRQAAPEASSPAASEGGVHWERVRGRHAAAQTSPEHQAILAANIARRETPER